MKWGSLRATSSFLLGWWVVEALACWVSTWSQFPSKQESRWAGGWEGGRGDRGLLIKEGFALELEV